MSRPKIIPRRTTAPTRVQKWSRILAFVPLSILLLERIWIPLNGTISGYLHVETIAATKTVKGPATLSSSSSSLRPMPPFPLDRITMSYRIVDSTCPRGTQRISNVGSGHEKRYYYSNPDRKIPKILHRQSPTRCVTPNLYHVHQQWEKALSLKSNHEGDENEDDGWALYLHNDEAMTRLLRMEEEVVTGEFPHLRQLIRNCVVDRDTKSLLWRYLILYVYGGVYADMDCAPEGFTGDTIRPSDDAFFLLDGSGQISNGFMATSPRHPMMYFALQHALHSLMVAEDVSMGSDIISLALQRAFVDFQNKNDESTDPKNLGSHSGTNNRTVTFVRNDSVDSTKNGTSLVTWTAIDPHQKKRDNKNMGMTTSPTEGQKGRQSCRMKILMDVMSTSTA